MKIYNNAIVFLPKARYVVERSGAVKALGKVLNVYASLNITKKRVQQAIIQQNWQRTLGK